MFRKKEILFLTSIIVFSFVAKPAFGAGSFSIGGKLVVDIINDLILFLLSLVGRISLLMLIVGGVFYIISGSNPESQKKAKKIIVSAIFGLMLVLCSYAIIKVITMFLV